MRRRSSDIDVLKAVFCQARSERRDDRRASMCAHIVWASLRWNFVFGRMRPQTWSHQSEMRAASTCLEARSGETPVARGVARSDWPASHARQ